MIEQSWLDYFNGGVPTLNFFELTLTDLASISKLNDGSAEIDRLQEVCFIGLISYFEAFCKDHFASIINIVPNVINNLKKNGVETKVDANDVILYQDEAYYKIGFLVAENIDFGSASKINNMYKFLLGITPFSKKETDYYNTMLRDRNLIVHHGGTYTLSYVKQLEPSAARGDAFYNSLIITKSDIENYISFIKTIAVKISVSSHKALNDFVSLNNLLIGKERQKAIDAFLWKNERT